MSARMLAIDLRRGPASALALALLGIGGALVLSAPGECDGQWPNAALALRKAMLVIPCVFAAGVWHGGSARRRHVDETIAAGPLPPWRRSAVEGGSIAVAGLAAFVVLLGAVTVAGGCTSGPVTAAALASLVATALALPAAAFSGLALGRFASGPMAAPLALFAALGVTFMLGGWSADAGQAMLVLPGVDDAVTARQLTFRISAGQALWFAGLAVFGWLCASRWPARFRPACVAPAAAGLAALLALSAGDA